MGFSALRAHVIVPIDRCPVLAPSMKGVIDIAWKIAEALSPLGKPLDIHATGTLNGLDIDVRGSGPLDPAHLGALVRVAGAVPIARITRHGEMVTQTRRPHDPHGQGIGAAAAGAVSAGDGNGRGHARPARGGACRQGEIGRRPVLRHRPVRAAACRNLPRHRDRQRPGRDRRAYARRAIDARPETGHRATARSVSRPAFGDRALRLRCDRVRSAASGGGGAGARDRQIEMPERDRGVLQRRHLRARCRDC